MKILDAKISEIKFQNATDFFEQFAQDYYTALFTGDEVTSEYSLIGNKPHTIIRFANNNFTIKTANKQFTVETEHSKCNNNDDFWKFTNEILGKTNFHEFAFPVSICGGMGYLSYEMLHQIEKIAKTTNANYQMPDFEWIFYNQYFVFDNFAKKAYEINLQYKNESNISKNEKVADNFKVEKLLPECNAKEYMQKVERIRDYIFAGDVYEVNLSQQICGDFMGNAFQLFKKLFAVNSAPFSTFLNFGENKIVCNSPELFLKCNNRKVETRPIKGTIQRGETPKEDEENKIKLLNTRKDEAELFMIIDLLRNDIGKVCEYGSVKVMEAKRLERFKNVHHLVGVIEGKLRENISYFDLLRATFPGGSITGCPKIRCMEIIDELETYARNLYTGTIFIMNQTSLISNIVIRSAIIQSGKIYLNSGGAITIDSNPKSEFEETEHKLKNIIEAVMGS